MAEDRGTLDIGRGEIHPFLVDEYPVIERDPAIGGQARIPPAQEPGCLSRAREGCKAQIVHARSQETQIVRIAPVIERAEGMGGKHQFGAFGQGRLDMVEGTKHQDIRIEIDGGLGVIAREEVSEAGRFDRGIEFHDGIAHRHVGKIGKIERVSRNDLELDRPAILRIELRVREKNDKACRGVGLMQGPAQRERIGQIILGANREIDGLRHNLCVSAWNGS